MAIYHLSATVISRSQGRSAVASIAYRSGEKLYDERLERTFDYRQKQAVAYKEILLPEGAPSWMKDRETLWNNIEKSENRKDSQLAREIQISLPKELTLEQNIELIKEFVQDEFVKRGMVADLCIHNPQDEAGELQPHAHVMLTMREITPGGFGKKVVAWNDKGLLGHWRETWAEYANRYLSLNGFDIRIDHRSLAEQGINLIPQKKIGPDMDRIYEMRFEEHQQIARQNGEAILEDPTIAFKAITKQQATFTLKDLACFVHRHSDGEDQFKQVYEKLRNSDEMIPLGVDDQGRQRFTTYEMFQIELRMIDDTYSLERMGHATKSIEAPEGLSPMQKESFQHLLLPGDIKCLVGYAGTGKSFLLREAKAKWEESGYRVLGATLSGIAAENLEGASGIESRTLASHFYYWDQEKHLGSRDILVVDEAGMLGSRQLGRVLETVKNQGAKVVLIGDPEQLQAIEAGAAFRSISSQTGYIELTEIRRQNIHWQQEATKELATHRTQEAIDRYRSYDHLHEYQTQASAQQGMVEMWNDARITNPKQTQIMLAYTKQDVRTLNEMGRTLRQHLGELGKEGILSTSRGQMAFSENDRIYFLKNDRSMGVKNGTLGTIEKIQDQMLTVRLDNTHEKEVTHLTFDMERYPHVGLGYAATIHKAQGVTVDRAYVLTSKYFDRHTTYVSMSRHHESVDIFWSKEVFQKPQDLYETLGRDRQKDVAVDYLHPFKDLSYLKNHQKALLTEEQIKEQEGRYQRLEERIQAQSKDRTPEQIRKNVKTAVEEMYREMGKPSPYEKAKKETTHEKNKKATSLDNSSRETNADIKNQAAAHCTKKEEAKPKKTTKEASLACVKYWNRLKEEALEDPNLREHHRKELIHFASKFSQKEVLVDYCQKHHPDFSKEIKQVNEWAKTHKQHEQTKVVTKTIEKDLELTL